MNSSHGEQVAMSELSYPQPAASLKRLDSDPDSVDVTIIKESGSRSNVLVAQLPVDGAGAGAAPQVEYRLYKRRFAGLFAIVLLNTVTGMAGSWFGSISENTAADFHITVDQVNWLANVGSIVYLVMAPFVPFIYRKLGIRWACLMSGLLTLVASWLRVLGTLKTETSTASLALLILAQMINGAANVLVEIMTTRYSQTWFDTKGRTTATMAVAMANPIGTAIGAVLAPAAGTTRESVLILAIIGTVGAFTAPLVGERPPTPPTYAAHAVHMNPPTFLGTIKALFGLEKDTTKMTYMTIRQRVDTWILLAVGSVLTAVVDAWTALSDEILSPYGYGDHTAGYSTLILLGVGLITSITMAPLLDRVFMKHMGLTIKVLCPFVGLGWLALIWAIRPNETVALFVLMAVIGAGSLTMLPVGLEMAVEVTRNAEGSAALFHGLVALLGIIFVQIETVMRRGPNAHPPFNFTTALIFNGVLACIVSASTMLLEGKQTRREKDEAMLKHHHFVEDLLEQTEQES